MICINYYYVIKSEARKLAINISNSIMLDEKYKRRYSGISSKEDFKKVINELDILYKQYGNNYINEPKTCSSPFSTSNILIKLFFGKINLRSPQGT